MKNLLYGLLLAATVVAVGCKKKKEIASTTEVKMEEKKEVTEAPKNLTVNPLVVDRNYTPAEKNDQFNILDSKIEGDSLILTVQYGGGCENHTFSLFSNNMYMKSLPMQLNLLLEHKGNNDMCRALLTHRIAFDIKACRPPSGNQLRISINGDREKMLDYKF
jgi:hypothetical protein